MITLTSFVKKPAFQSLALILAFLALILPCHRISAVTPWTLLINTNNVINVTNYGAIGDGVTTNTAYIQNAINAAAAGGTTNGLAGGTVEIPPGIFMCGPINLKSSVNLQIDSGGILRMLPFGQYPLNIYDPVNGYWIATNFISGSSLHDIEISGTGHIEGQGEPWWPYASNSAYTRPIMIRLNSCNRQLIQDVMLSNSPEFHISISGSAANTTVQHVTILANSSSDPVNPGHNTDACDVAGTNILVQNCNISVGDDNFTCGGSTSDILLTNNTYGNGHGVSIGSYTSPFVSNMTVINCTFNNTDQGIRIKTDRDRGGYVHNINYYNLSMTNVMRPILIYCQYTNTNSFYRAVDSISPAVAASYPTATVTGSTPYYRDIMISNVTATVQSGRTAGLIWGLPESSVSNLTLAKITITASKTFGIYCAKNVQIVDSQIITPAGVADIAFYDAAITFSNSTLTANTEALDGASASGIGNTLSLYNALASLVSTNALDGSPGITVGNSTLTVSNNLNLDVNSVVNFVLGTNASKLAVTGSLMASGTINATAGGGFTNGTYTLFTDGGGLAGWGPPVFGTMPPGYNYAFDTNIAGQIKLIVSTPVTVPPPPTNLTAATTNGIITLSWSQSATANGYNIKRSTTNGGAYTIVSSNSAATTYFDSQVTAGTTYYYVVSGVNSAGEGTNSAQLSATAQSTTVVLASSNIFVDTFSNSTLNSATPVASGRTNTSYEIMSSKSWNPSPSIAPGHLTYGIGSTTSGSIQAQALFAGAPVALTNVGDKLSLTVSFVDTSGLLTQSGAMGFGLYRSGQSLPVAGGLNGTATTNSTSAATGAAQNWLGYVGQLSFTGASSQILTRLPQMGVANNNQDTVTTSSGSSSYVNPSAGTVGSASSIPSVTLVAGNAYTEVFSISLLTNKSLAITNFLYSGADTTGTLLSQFGAVTSGSTYLTNAFDSLAIGWRVTSNVSPTTIDINKITVSTVRTAPGSTVSQTPPTLLYQNVGSQLQLSWPMDHIGWTLQIQTNGLGTGVGTNWVRMTNSASTNTALVPAAPANSAVFLRLVYP